LKHFQQPSRSFLVDPADKAADRIPAARFGDLLRL